MECYICFEIDEEIGSHYPMRYDDVLYYANEMDKNFSKFHLLQYAPSNPMLEESISVARRRLAFRSGIAEEPAEVDNEMPGLRSGDEPEDDDDASDCAEDDVPRLFARTEAEDWTHVKEGESGRDVSPIPYTGKQEQFDVKLTDEELGQLTDASGDIRYHKVVEHLLLSFGHETFWEWVAARMRSYTTHIIRTEN